MHVETASVSTWIAHTGRAVAAPKTPGASLTGRRLAPPTRVGYNAPRMERLLAILALVSSGAVGCGRCGGERAPETPDQPEQPADVAVVEGVVRLAEGAELPAYPPVERSPAQPAQPETCPPPREADRQPVTMGEARGLANVLVAAAEFDTAPPHAPVTHELFIRDCQLTPMFVAATRGDTLEITNETDYPFMPVSAGAGMAQALMRGESRTIPLDQGGVKGFGCTFTAACGRTEVVVLYHPLHTLTAEAGRFRLEVPAGEEIEIHAWHPLFEEAKETVTVPAGETRRLELTLSPSAPAPPPPPAQDPEPEGEGDPSNDEPDPSAPQPENETETLF